MQVVLYSWHELAWAACEFDRYVHRTGSVLSCWMRSANMVGQSAWCSTHHGMIGQSPVTIELYDKQSILFGNLPDDPSSTVKVTDTF